MPNYNKMTAIGHLGRDPEAKVTNGGTSFTTFPLAVTEYTKKKDGDGFNETTTWFDCVCWDKYIAEKIARAGLHKGAAVMVSGPVNCRAYAAQDGSARASMGINVKEFVSLDRKATQQNQQPQQNQYAGQAQPQPQDFMAGGYTSSEDDDLPF